MTAPLLSMREAADRIGMSYDWLRKRVKADEVPCYRFGASVRFSEEQVEAIKLAHLHAPGGAALVYQLTQPRPSPPPPQPPNPGGPTNPPRRRVA